ncbi:MAG: hypothetical protein SF123_10620 [Chloroflexota bacterium]|nr:hypothetical protein [Chloroflexota bacterium]
MPVSCDAALDETVPGAELGVQVCLTNTETVRYSLNGEILGETAFDLFAGTYGPQARMVQMGNNNGSLAVLNIFRTQFVANFYSTDGNLIYSYAFRMYPEAFG